MVLKITRLLKQINKTGSLVLFQYLKNKLKIFFIARHDPKGSGK